LTAFFAAVAQETNRFGEPHTPTTLAHIQTTLRAALNSAIREGLIRHNPTRQVELPSGRRAHALVWAPGRLADWHTTGIRPTIPVWTAAQLAAFLDSVHPDRLYALWCPGSRGRAAPDPPARPPPRWHTWPVLT
jgi:hypothetical protein